MVASVGTAPTSLAKETKMLLLHQLAIYGCEVSESNRFTVAYETTKIPYLPLAV